MSRNLTIPDVTWEDRCENKEITRQDCFETIDLVNKTKTEQICHEFEEEVCHNYTVPNYKVVSLHKKFYDAFPVTSLISSENGTENGESSVRLPAL